MINASRARSPSAANFEPQRTDVEFLMTIIGDNVLTEEEEFLIETVRTFIDRDVKPAVNEVEAANEYPEAWIEQMKELGIYGLAVPEEYDGNPVSMPAYAKVTEELSRGWMSLAGALGGHTVVDKLMSEIGTEEQNEEELPRLATC